VRPTDPLDLLRAACWFLEFLRVVWWSDQSTGCRERLLSNVCLFSSIREGERSHRRIRTRSSLGDQSVSHVSISFHYTCFVNLLRLSTRYLVLCLQRSIWVGRAHRHSSYIRNSHVPLLCQGIPNLQLPQTLMLKTSLWHSCLLIICSLGRINSGSKAIATFL
jgi:hypothetical protein